MIAHTGWASCQMFFLCTPPKKYIGYLKVVPSLQYKEEEEEPRAFLDLPALTQTKKIYTHHIPPFTLTPEYLFVLLLGGVPLLRGVRPHPALDPHVRVGGVGDVHREPGLGDVAGQAGVQEGG